MCRSIQEIIPTNIFLPGIESASLKKKLFKRIVVFHKLTICMIFFVVIFMNW